MVPPLKDMDMEGVVPASGDVIHEVKAELDRATVLMGDRSAGVARSPYLSFKVKQARSGNTLRLSWTDSSRTALDFIDVAQCFSEEWWVDWGRWPAKRLAHGDSIGAPVGFFRNVSCLATGSGIDPHLV